MLVYLNGEYIPHAEAKVSVDDRGFIFGDGVYEVVRAIGGRLFTADEHLARMRHGMAALGMVDCEETGGPRFREISERLLRDNDLLDGEATVYVQVTRGAAPRAHRFPDRGTPPTVYLSTSRFDPPVELRGAGASAITTADLRWSRCHLKTINLLPNVLAKQMAVEAGAVEAILVRDGAVTEGSSTNVFAVVDGALRTYPVSNFILPGITRALILALAAERGIAVVERPLLVEDLSRVEEIFVTGTTTDVLPIVQLDGRPVGAGRPGPITRVMQEALAVRMAEPVLA